MTYVKLLTAPLIIMAGLAFLTACGGVTVNPTIVTNGNNTTAECRANPFAADCINPTPTQQATFCRDDSKTTATKTNDCAPVALRACDANVFDKLCPNRPSAQEQENFCRDKTKTPAGKANNCALIIVTACSDNIHDPICNGVGIYEEERRVANTTCLARTSSQAVCNEEVRMATCDADPFPTNCVEQEYLAERRMTCLTDKNSSRCRATEGQICGVSGNIFDDFCTGLTATNDSRKTECESGEKTRMECIPTVTRICGSGGNIFDDFCTGLTDTDDLRKTKCESGNRNRDECTDTITRICGENRDSLDDFCTGLPDPDEMDTTDDMDDMDTTDDMDDMDDMDTADDPEKMRCGVGMPDRGMNNCMDTEERICGTDGDPLDPFCVDIAAYYPAQKSECKKGDSSRGECIPTVMRICRTGGEPLDSLCTGLDGTDGLRRIACASGDKRGTSDCRATELRICGADIFDAFCTGLRGTDDTRQTKCEVGMPDRGMPVCMTTEERICGENGDVFNVFCTGLTNIASMRIADCIMAGNAGDTKCNTIASAIPTNNAITACLANPFTEACKANRAFGTHADMARTNRIGFCETGGNGDNALCMDRNLMSLCRFAPFNQLCTDPLYQRHRQTQCQRQSNIHSSCPTLLSNLEGVVDVTDITGIADIVTPIYTTGVLDHDELPTTLATTGTGGFVVVGEDGLIDGGGGFLTRRGDSNDRVAWRKIGTRNFAGIAPTTNLGAPLLTGTGQPTSVVWAGTFYNFAHTDNNYNTNINFVINFEEGTMEGRSPGGRNSTEFILTFTPTGVITGYVYDRNLFNLRTDDELRVLAGNVRGLIGEEGMVGAWRGDAPNAVNGYVIKGRAVGGFVADNPNFVADSRPSVASTADWARSFVLPLPATIAISDPGANVVGDFLNLADGATTIVAEDLKTEAGGSTASTSAILPRAGSNDMDGFVYISGFGFSLGSGNNQAFVGLLPTTDLGALLTEQPSVSIAAWAGSYYDSIAAASAAATFNIDFSNRSISTSGISAASPPAFNLAFNDAGVITGTVTKNSIAAIARGLIGKEGLVGAFIDTSPTGSVFHGGFVATAPTCLVADNCVKHAIWLESFSASPLPTTINASITEAKVFGGFLNLADGATTIAPDTFDSTGFATVLTARPASETGFNAPVPTASALPLTRDGDAMDGVVYIGGYNFNNYQAFVGLLSTTNLGDPFPISTASDTMATWRGKYYRSSNSTVASSPVDFLIDFSGARTIDGTDVGTGALIFDLGFTAEGIITGTATDTVNTATASGLIGRQGLVGVFVDKTPAQVGQTTVLYGGFVADNPNP